MHLKTISDAKLNYKCILALELSKNVIYTMTRISLSDSLKNKLYISG